MFTVHVKHWHMTAMIIRVQTGVATQSGIAKPWIPSGFTLSHFVWKPISPESQSLNIFGGTQMSLFLSKTRTDDRMVTGEPT